MQLLTYRNGAGEHRAGLRVDGAIYDAGSATGRADCGSILSILENWDELEPVLTAAAAQPGALAEVASLATPVLYPGAVYCAAANYRDHMHAMAVKLNQPDEPDPRELDIKPYHFTVPARTCVIGTDAPIELPDFGANVDWEIELVAVIGRPARNVSVADALDHVAGYTIGNDVSVRDMRYLKIPNVPLQSLFRSDFIAMKGFDRSCVIGPWITLARDIPDPQKLAMQLWIDGEPMQDSSSAQMVFGVAEQISYLSSRVTLHPGDLVMTGTPAGTGMERDRFLKPGETLKLEIEGIGEFSQKVVASPGRKAAWGREEV